MFAQLGIIVLLAGLGLYFFGRLQRPALARVGLPVAGAGLLLALIGNALVIIPAGQVGVVFSVVSGVRPAPLNDGVHFVAPFLNSVTLYDARLQEITLSRRGEDGPNVDESIQARSKEGLGISADVTVQFRVQRADVPRLHRELGPDYIRTVIRPQVRSKVRDAIGQFNAADIISTQRRAVEEQVTQGLRAEFEEAHLELQSVLLRELRIPDSVAKAIEEKQTAEQQVAVERNRLQQANIAAQRRVVEARAESDAAIARAEGEARALSLRGKALKENPEIIQLTVAEKLSPSIQTVMLPSEGNFLLDVGALTRARTAAPAAQPDTTSPASAR